MKAILCVPSNTPTKDIKELLSTIRRSFPGIKIRSERKFLLNQFYFGLFGPIEKKVAQEHLVVVTQIIVSRGFTWAATSKYPEGCCYPKPLRETAEAYRVSEAADRLVDAQIALGINPMEALLDQERRLNPAVRRSSGPPPLRFLPIDHE